MKAHTGISVIIPTLNPGNILEELLESLKAQEQKIAEIIVIDSGSADNTLAAAERQGAVVLSVGRNAFDHGGTRNYAAGKAAGGILLFMTQDALPADAKTVGNLVRPLREAGIVVSYARQVPAPDANVSEQYLRLANYPPASRVKSKADLPELGIKTFQSSNACAAYRRDVFEALGGFPQPIVCNEDMIFAARAIMAGYRVSYTAGAVVRHTHRYNCIRLFRRYFDISASLDHEPLIRKLGGAEAKGLDFLRGQLAFLREKGKLHHLPLVLLEAGGKFLGYKAGGRHRAIPRGWKKHLGMNTLYWTRAASNPLSPWGRGLG